MGILFSLTSFSLSANNVLPVSYQLDVEEKTFTFNSASTEDCNNSHFLYPFPIIAKELGAEYKYDNEQKILTVIRAPDKAVFTLSFSDGLVTVGGKTVGYVPNIASVKSEYLLLNQPAIEVLTGTHFDCDADNHSIAITLDKRLKPQFGFSLLVDGRPLVATEVLPRSIGSVLLLPLKPILKELAQQLTRVNGNIIEIYRTQDSVTFSLDLQSGIIKMNGTPIGITPNMSYARQDQLLLPSTAIETLTGTNIKIIPGQNRVEITLDDRLKNRVLPSEYILKQAANTYFVPESLEFFIGNQNINKLTLRSHFHEFNTKIRYEVPDFPRSGEDLKPSWVSMEFDSLRGYSGSLGDYNSKHRELREIDVSRIRGLSLNTVLDDGWIIGAAGVPLVGSKQRHVDKKLSSNNTTADAGKNSSFTSSFDVLNQSSPTFKGFAAGIRFLHKSRQWETGISARDSLHGDSPRVVANYYRTWLYSAGFIKDVSTSLDVDLGAFTDGYKGPVDSRVRFNHAFKPASFMRVNMTADYSGVNFENTAELLTDTKTAPDNNLNKISDSLNSSLLFNFNLPDNTGLSFFGNWSQTGLRTDYVDNNVSYGANLSVRPFQIGPWMSLTYAKSYGKTAEQGYESSSEVASIRANQEIDWFNYAARFEYDLFDNHKIASLNLSHTAVEYNFPKQALISANLIATGIWSSRSGIRSNLGGRIHADTGSLLGAHWNVGTDFTRFQPLPALLEEEGQEDTSATNFISVYSVYKFSKNYELSVNYSNDFGDDHTFRLSLQGRIGINPPRRYKKTLEGRGILKGRLFLDANADGIFQQGEKSLAGVKLSIEGTKLALRTDIDGYYTIANMPTGSFRVNVDEEQLPLGLVRESAYINYATVGDGQITQYDIPMIKSGQISGRIFLDANGNGLLDRGEKGLEGVSITLSPGDLTTVSSMFGQYAFDELLPGSYHFKMVDIDDGEIFSNKTVGSDNIVIDTDSNWLQKVNIPVKTDK